MSTALAEKIDSEIVSHPASDSAALIQAIARAASDPNVDIDKMERLWAMHEKMVNRDARSAFAAALAEMQPELPTIDRKGNIVIYKKDAEKKPENIIQSTKYALWEDINDAIRPIISQHGFALSFRVKKEADRVEVTGVLSHRLGHFEETMLSLPMDTTGSKNNVQAIGSSISYAKRYTAGALLNITSRGEDDDGVAAGAPAVISDEQLKKLQALASDVGGDVAKLCKHFKIDALPDLPVAKLPEAIGIMEMKRQKVAAK